MATFRAISRHLLRPISKGYVRGANVIASALLERTSFWSNFSGLRLADISPTVLTAEEANRKISEALVGDAPVLVGRLGSTETQALLALRRATDFRLGKKFLWALINLEFPDLARANFSDLASLSGFFPSDDLGQIERFAELYTEAANHLDIIGSWLPGENVLISSRDISVTKLDRIEPFFVKNPWSQSLENRKVLVVHPFAKTIQTQYLHNRKGLFDNPGVLPTFDLDVLAPPVTYNRGSTDITNETSDFWFRKLEELEEGVLRRDFDVAIIGAGAYGLPLGSFIKGLGRKAVVLGGATQLLFGIRGRRWEEKEDYREIFTTNWVRPSPDETPENSLQIEGGAYY